jgi:hypothetical protein
MDSCRVFWDKKWIQFGESIGHPPSTMQTFPPHYSKLERELLIDAYQAITACDLWDWMKTYTPDKDKGFVFSTHPNLDRINAAMKYQGHSGGSYGWTMRTMEHIAKLGWNEALNPPCPCRIAKGLTFGGCGVAGINATCNRPT